jgi:hypothetical protein
MHDEALHILQGSMEKVVIHSAQERPGIELIGAIAPSVQLGQAGRTAKHAALDERTACSVKLVAGACNYRVPLVQIAI